MSTYMELEGGMIIKTQDPSMWNNAKRLSAAEGKRRKKAYAIARLLELVAPGDVIYTVLRHVSASGMSRRIDLYVIKDNKPIFLSGYASDALEMQLHPKKQGLVVGGAGMDMGFHIVYNLSMALFCPGKYDHDSAYSLKHEWL